jgi:O-antigen/teichoic acid export membrane protein
MNNQKKVLYNTGIQLLGKIIATILGLAAMVMITRYLGTNGFGKYTTIITYISFFAIIADLGLTLITIQMISVPGVSEKKVLDNLLGLRMVSALIFLSLGPISILFFPYENSIKIGVLILSLSFLFIALNQVLVGLFQKKLRMDKTALAEIFGRLILVLGVWLSVKLGYGLNGILWSTVLGSFFNFLLQYIFSHKFVKIGIKFEISLWKKIIKKAWPLALIIVFNLIYLKTDILILSAIKTPEEVGIYGAAYKIIDILVTLPFMFSGLVLPFLTANWLKGKKENFKKITQKAYDFMVLLAIPLIFAVEILAPEIIYLIAGKEFIISAQILRILILAAGLIFIGTIFSHAIIAIEKQKKLIPLYIFVGITSLIGYLIFIPKYSYFGAAWTTIYSEFTITMVSIFYLYKMTNFLPKQKILFKSLLSSLLMFVVLLLLSNKLTFSWLNLIILSIIGLLVYLTTLYILKGFSKKDLLIFKKDN